MQNTQLLSITLDFLSRLHLLKKEDILPLREIIREHNRLYHELENPVISDTEYDQLFHALARLESNYDMLDEDSPTAKLAILTSSQFQKVSHIFPMISLDNTYSVGDVRDFEERMRRVLKEQSIVNFPYFIQPKYDGLGLALIYKFGKLTQAVTRGNGLEGEDVTLTALEIEEVPHFIEELSHIERMEIRGEVMMSRTAFDHVNRERLLQGEKLFANPRNAASGSLRQLDPLVTRTRHLRFFAYSIPQIEQGQDSNFKIFRYRDLLSLLLEWGFESPGFDFSIQDGLDNLCNVLQYETENRREYFDFDIDGMVLKLDDMSLWDDLGRTEHHPRYAIAYKFPAKQVRTKVLSIEHSVGRTGTVTPVANLEGVDVSGVIVRRATLHNYDELLKKGVREGDYVFIMRAGEVIPEIVSVITEVRNGSEKEILPPTHCPICHTPLLQDEGKVAIYCPNPHCEAKILGQMEMFVSKQAMNIDGLGPRQLELFLETGWITDFASIYDLETYRNDILLLEGFKEKSVQNLIDSIDASRRTTLDRMLVGLGIPNVGKKTARSLAKIVSEYTYEGELDPILGSLFSITVEDLLEVKDIGPETARAFAEFMGENQELVSRLFSKLSFASNTTKNTSDSLIAGKSFCVTGSFDSLSRDEIHELIEKHGGEVRSSVSSKLDYLIAGESARSKLAKAQECNVNILTLDEFLKKIA